MQASKSARSASHTVIATVAVACALFGAQPGRGAPNTGLIALQIDERVARRLDNLETGELKITWGEDGPVVKLGELRTGAESVREFEKASAAPPVDGCFLVAPFEYTTKNRLGGSTRVTGRASARLVVAHPGAAGHALQFEFEEGPITPQIELSLYDADPEDDTVFYLDGRQYDRFELRVRGTGTGSVSATLMDAHGRTADAVALSLSDTPASDEWRSVPISTDVDGIHRHHLARLQLRGHGSGILEVEDVYLCPVNATPKRSFPPRRETTNSLWVWHTSDLLAGGIQSVNDLADLAQQAAVSRIYLQVPGSLVDPETRQALQAAATRLRAAGISLLALDGAPEYALPSEHGELLDTVARVIDYNDAVPPQARFVGVHLDVEPYLLDEWDDARAEIVSGYLDMLDAVRERTAGAGLELDVAVPFWFDSVSVHRQRNDRVERLSLTDAVLARVDSIAVMDYRTEAGGSNGLLALAGGELAAAAERGRDVWIGLETTWLPDQTLVRFRGDARAGLPDSAGQEWWVVQTPRTLWAVRGDALDALGDRLQNVDITNARHWPAHAVEVPASRQTFYDLGSAALFEAMRETSAQLDGHPAFAGLALHYDRPLRRLLDGASE